MGQTNHNYFEGSPLLGRVLLVWVLMALFAFSQPLYAEPKKSKKSGPANQSGAKSIVKWVDDQGVVHYGERLPTDETKRNNTVLNRQGIVVKQNKPGQDQLSAIEQKQLQQANQEQLRKDNALLAVYSSEADIDAAKERNLQLDMIAMQGLEQSKKNALRDQQETNSYISKLKSKNKPIPADVQAEVKQNQDKIIEVDKKIARLNKLMEDKRVKYDADKKRFAEIKPAASSVQDIKKKEALLAELKEWKVATDSRIAKIQQDLVIYKRQGKTAPEIEAKLSEAQAEVLRADAEIKETEAAINQMRISASGTKSVN